MQMITFQFIQPNPFQGEVLFVLLRLSVERYLHQTDLVLVVYSDKKELRPALLFGYEVLYLFYLDDFGGWIADFGIVTDNEPGSESFYSCVAAFFIVRSSLLVNYECISFANNQKEVIKKL